MGWTVSFDSSQTEPPLDEEALAVALRLVFAPLTESEVEMVLETQQNPFNPGTPEHEFWRPVDPSNWLLPHRALPRRFIQLLSWSNGGWFCNGAREIGLFSLDEVREYLISYHFPEYMLDIVPFGLDGRGTFYAFDMRNDATEGEYPILAIESGNPFVEDACLVASTLEEALTGREPIEELLKHGTAT